MSRDDDRMADRLNDDNPADKIYTPEWIAQDMIGFFHPVGRILEPCRGGGVFTNLLPEADWCEIDEGKDFLHVSTKYDWIITNPPYSKLRLFIMHSLKIADNIVFLIPIWKFWQAYGTIRAVHSFGGTKHIRWYGTGSKCGFPMGNAIGAIHWQRGYRGDTDYSFYEDDSIFGGLL